MNPPAGAIGSAQSSDQILRLDLNSPGRRIIFLALFFALIGGYSYRVLRSYIASRASQIVERKTLERAIRLESGNAEYFDRLGRFIAAGQQDAPAALQYYRRSVALNPYVADYWLDLAGVYEFTGDRQAQERALNQAIVAAPRTPNVAWQAANFYLLQRNTQKALRLLRVPVENDPDYNQSMAALNLAWRATHDPALILRDTVPPQPEAYLRFLQLLITADQPEPASQVWQQLVGLRRPLDIRQALQYIDFCLLHRNVDAATKAWTELLTLDGQLQPYRSPDEQVVNGSFEEDILNGGFDWRYQPAANIVLTLDSSVFHSGLRSLAIDFSQSRADPGLTQLVAVEPETDYRFSAFVKTERLDGANGPRFIVSDAHDNTPYVLTEDVLGSSAWRHLTEAFRTRKQTNLLAIHIVRSPPNTFLDGKIWIDDVSIKHQEKTLAQ